MLKRPRPILTGRSARVAAFVIAVVAWAGLVLDVVDVDGRTGSLAMTLWFLLNFFTITTNLAVAALFTRIALRGTEHETPSLVAGLALAMVLVGVVYAILLAGLYVLGPLAQIGDVLLHRVTPVLVPLFWFAAVPKGRLLWRDPALWALYPLGYLAITMTRGAFSGTYPYPFIDVLKIGWGQATLNAVLIAIGFLVTGYGWVWLDRTLARRLASAPSS